MGGTHTQLADLIRLRHAASALNALTPKTSRNPMAGMLSSRFRGRGIDFAEVRLYQPGDDIRTIDWRVTARTGKAHTKLFQEEREKPVLLLVDQSAGMFFGSRRAFKSVQAAETAAILAWSVLDRGDRLGGVVFSGDSHREIKPRRSRNAVLGLLREINNFNNQLSRESISARPSSADGRELDENKPINHALNEIRRVAKHGSTLYIISDFQQFNEETEIHLTELSKHNDIFGICIYDQLEKQLPSPDIYDLTDGVHRHRIDTGNKAYRQRYQSKFTQHYEGVRGVFDKLRSPFIMLETAMDPISSLVEDFSRLSRPALSRTMPGTQPSQTNMNKSMTDG